MSEMKKHLPFGNITIQNISRRLIDEALAAGRISSGNLVRRFEERFAELVGVREAIAVSSGTDADILALSVLYDFGARRGDEVIIPALSFVATGHAVIHAGFTPVFVDIDPVSLNIDPEKIEAVITEKTRAIMPVHLMGKPADMVAIRKIADRYGLVVIEDAAQAHGALYKGKTAGSIGDMAAFSLYVAHLVTTGEGGIVTTDNESYAKILRSLRSHGRACDCRVCRLNVSSGYCPERFREGRDIRFVTRRPGFSSKMNELEAALGIGCLEAYPAILEKRRANLMFVLEHFEQFHPWLTTISEQADERIGPHAIPIIVGKEAPFSRNDLMRYLEENGIETRTLFEAMPTQCVSFAFLGHAPGDFPQAEYIGDNGLHVGVHDGLGIEEMQYLLDVLKRFTGRHHG
ncbi:MAG: DegT/DnrJ/EryC1/StrS family aminotransferase [Thermodesulfobacteriota bacterium]